MRRCCLSLSLLLFSSLLAGCRGSALLNSTANCIDDINDTHVYFDNWYCPRLDISRAGRPDWCGPINNRLAPGICYLGSWNRYDDENLYPPSNPYLFPGKVTTSSVRNSETVPTPAPTEIPPTPSGNSAE
jgi:hypothetical protein